MKTYSLTHLSDETLLRDAPAVHAQERSNTALGLAHIAEIDFRKLYRQAGHPSIHSYCVKELCLSPQAAFKRIHAARAARRFPAILVALAEGRLHLSMIVTIAASLTEDTADELIRAAENKTKFEVERLLAERKLAAIPSGEMPLRSNLDQELSLGKVEAPATASAQTTDSVPCEAPGLERVLTIQRQYPVRFSMSEEMASDLRRAQNLLGHQVPSGDLAAVLHRGLQALIRELEKRKLGLTDRSRRNAGAIPDGRHVPARVRRAVWRRDGGQCTFVAENGARCPAHTMLEFDHVVPVARGGRSTESNVRLLCRAHNQYLAELTYGAELMEGKRRESGAERANRSAREKESADQVIGCMRRLGFTADESRRAAAHAEAVAGDSLEGRVRAALSYLVPPKRRGPQPVTPGTGEPSAVSKACLT